MAFRRKAAEEREDLFSTDKLDLVALVDGVVELHVVVDVAWTGSDAQLLSLQEKIHTYVGYAVDGPLVADYPQTDGLPWRIVINCRTGEPDPRSAELLEQLAEPVSRYGGDLTISSE